MSANDIKSKYTINDDMSITISFDQKDIEAARVKKEIRMPDLPDYERCRFIEPDIHRLNFQLLKICKSVPIYQICDMERFLGESFEERIKNDIIRGFVNGIKDFIKITRIDNPQRTSIDFIGSLYVAMPPDFII